MNVALTPLYRVPEPPSPEVYEAERLRVKALYDTRKGARQAAAFALRMSPSFVSDVLLGRRHSVYYLARLADWAAGAFGGASSQ